MLNRAIQDTFFKSQKSKKKKGIWKLKIHICLQLKKVSWVALFATTLESSQLLKTNINQPRTPSFPIGLLKTASDFIVRLVETGLIR